MLINNTFYIEPPKKVRFFFCLIDPLQLHVNTHEYVGFSFDSNKIDLIILSFHECFLFPDISEEKNVCFSLNYISIFPIFLYFVLF